MTLAYVTNRNIECKDFPITSMKVSQKDWRELCFKCMQLDNEDDLAFKEGDHPDHYNMILLHPRSKKLFWAYSHDFDFK